MSSWHAIVNNKCQECGMAAPGQVIYCDFCFVTYWIWLNSYFEHGNGD